MPLLNVDTAQVVTEGAVASDPPRKTKRGAWWKTLEQVAERYISGEFGQGEWVRIAVYDSVSGARVKAKQLRAKVGELPCVDRGEWHFNPTTHIAENADGKVARYSVLNITFVVRDERATA